MTIPRFWLIVPAAGIGQRMQSAVPKQYLRIQQRFLLDVTLSRLLAAYAFDGCMVPLHPDDCWWSSSDSAADARIRSCIGGEERADSVLAALQALAPEADRDDWVLVHDVARPCLHPDDLQRLVTTLKNEPVGGLLATPVTDTLKRAVADTGCVADSPDRRQFWRAMTPQMFRFGLLKAALEDARLASAAVTDESSALEMSGYQPRLVTGRSDNIKVTTPGDLDLAAFILAGQESSAQSSE